MLIRSLSSNYLKSILRSRFAGLNLTAKILAIVFIWMPMYLYATAAGLFIDLALNELAPNADIPALASGAALYFLVFWSGLDIFLRPRISLPLFPYLATPITRGKLALFYQAISVFGKINFLPFLFVLAFWFRNFLLKDVSFAWGWLLLFLSLSACFHLLTNLLRMSLSRRYLPMLCTLLVVVALAAMEWRYDIPTLSVLSTVLFEATLGGAVWPLAIVLVAGAAALYASTGRIIRALYVDDTILSRPRKKVAGKGVDRSFSDGMLSFEWKLIWRNKRTRLIFIQLPAFIYLGINPIVFSTFDHSDAFLSFSFGLVIIGSVMFTMMAYNFRSTFYEGMMARPGLINVVIRHIFRISNAILVGAFIIIAIIVILVRDFYTLPLTGYMLLFGLGVAKYIASLTWIFTATRLELNRHGFGEMNFKQGGWISTLFAFLIIFPPPLLIWLLPGSQWGGMAIGALGLAGLLLRRRWIASITKTLEKKRYVLMEEFRKG